MDQHKWLTNASEGLSTDQMFVIMSLTNCRKLQMVGKLEQKAEYIGRKRNGKKSFWIILVIYKTLSINGFWSRNDVRHNMLC